MAVERFQKFASGGTQLAVALNGAGARLRMAQGEELEFQKEQYPAAVAGEAGVVLAEGLKTFVGRLTAVQQSANGVDLFGDDPFHQCEEQVFFTVEMCIEGAAGESGTGGDLFEARGFKTVAGEDELGGREKLGAGGRGALLLAGNAGRRAGRG